MFLPFDEAPFHNAGLYFNIFRDDFAADPRHFDFDFYIYLRLWQMCLRIRLDNTPAKELHSLGSAIVGRRALPSPRRQVR